MTSTQGNMDAFSARLKQSSLSVQVARVALQPATGSKAVEQIEQNGANARHTGHIYLLRHVENTKQRSP